MSTVRKLLVIVMGVLALTIAARTGPAVATSKTATPRSATITATTTTTPGYSSSYPIAISLSDGEHGLLLLQRCETSICKSWVEITADGAKHWQQRPPFVTYPAGDYYVYGGGVLVKNP